MPNLFNLPTRDKESNVLVRKAQRIYEAGGTPA
jgi:hypothetical protein